MDDPIFTDRRALHAWVRQRIRYPDPYAGAALRALADVKRVTIAHLHLPPLDALSDEG